MNIHKILIPNTLAFAKGPVRVLGILAFQIERNLEFEDYICQVDLSRDDDLWDPSNELVSKPKPPEVLQVELAPPKRKWSLSHESNTPFQELPLEKGPPKNEIEIFLPETVEKNPPEDFPLFIHKVGHPFSKNIEFTPFYVTLQVKDSLLRNWLLHPNATTK